MRLVSSIAVALTTALFVTGCPILVEDNYTVGSPAPPGTESGAQDAHVEASADVANDVPSDGRSPDAQPDATIPDGSADAGTCSNRARDGRETDVDCGGP